MIDLAFAGFALGPDPLSLVTFALAIFALGWALKEHGRAVAAAEAVSSAEARAAARVTQAELRLLLATQSESEVLDRLDSAVAVFGPDRKLQSFNIAFAERSRLVTAWLETRPLLEDVLDRLRAERHIPERRDFAAWKSTHLSLFESGATALDETWHLSGGDSLRVRGWPRRLGGVIYVMDDVSETLRTLTAMQTMAIYRRATLDTIPDGLAVFDANGRLALYNTAFARLWPLSEEELEAEPHLASVAALVGKRMGSDRIWPLVSEYISAGDVGENGVGVQAQRIDGRILWVILTRLPLGATLVSFEDRTEIERFEEAIGLGSALG